MSTTSESGSGVQAAWEDSVELLLCRWARACKQRNVEHESMARKAELCNWLLAVPLVLFPVAVAPLVGPFSPYALTPGGSAGALLVCAAIMGILLRRGPLGLEGAPPRVRRAVL